MIDVVITREDFDPGRARTLECSTRHPESTGLSAGFTSICCVVVQPLAKGEDAKLLGSLRCASAHFRAAFSIGF
jgi:hypothetical protein